MQQLAGARIAGFQLLDQSGNGVGVQRVALDGGVHFASNDRVERSLNGVAANDDDVLARNLAGGLDGVDGAQGHVVVLSEEDVDIFVSLQEALHNGLAFSTGEVAGLGSDNLVVRVLRQDLVDTSGTVGRSGGAGGAFQDRDVDFFGGVHVVDGPASHTATFFNEVTAERAGVLDIGHAVGHTVDQDERNLSLVDFLQDFFPTGGHNAGEEDVVDALGDEVAQSLNLVFLLLLRIVIDHVPAFGFGHAAQRVGVGGTPVRLLANLGEADGQRGRVSDAADHEREGEYESQELLHSVASYSFLEFRTLQAYTCFLHTRISQNPQNHNRKDVILWVKMF